MCSTNQHNNLPERQSVLNLQQYWKVVAEIEAMEQTVLQNGYQQFPWCELLVEHDGGNNLKGLVLVESHNGNSYMSSLSNTHHLSTWSIPNKECTLI